MKRVSDRSSPSIGGAGRAAASRRSKSKARDAKKWEIRLDNPQRKRNYCDQLSATPAYQ